MAVEKARKQREKKRLTAKDIAERTRAERIVRAQRTRARKRKKAAGDK